MAHRQEEKQRRREERLARERAEKAAAARRKRLQWAGGAVLALAVVAVAVILVVSGLGGGNNVGQAAQPSTTGVTLPRQQIADVNAAAKAAGCTRQHHAIEGRTPLTKRFTTSDYKTKPPTSGNHYPSWYPDGVYLPGDVPNLG